MRAALAAVILGAATALAVGRFRVPFHAHSWAGTYEALAHLATGGLIGAWLCGLALAQNRLHWLCGWAALALTVVELIAAESYPGAVILTAAGAALALWRLRVWRRAA